MSPTIANTLLIVTSMAIAFWVGTKWAPRPISPADQNAAWEDEGAAARVAGVGASGCPYMHKNATATTFWFRGWRAGGVR
jgi:ribosome modulation factor